MADHDFRTVVESAHEHVKRGSLVFQKFTCASCGNRLTMEEPNTFYTRGTCDKCGHETDIEAAGHNFLLVQSLK